MSTQNKMDDLVKQLICWQYEYYVLALPSVPDREYDKQFDELEALEKKYPQFCREYSPTKIIGSDLASTYPDWCKKMYK